MVGTVLPIIAWTGRNESAATDVVAMVAAVVGDAIFLPEVVRTMGMMTTADRMTVMTTMIGDVATRMIVITTMADVIRTSEIIIVTTTTVMAEMIVGITDKALPLETTVHVQLTEIVIPTTIEAAITPILVLQHPLLASPVTIPLQDQRIVPLAPTLSVMHLSLQAKHPAAQHILPLGRVHQQQLVSMPRKATPAPTVNLHTPALHNRLARPPPQHPIPDLKVLLPPHIHPLRIHLQLLINLRDNRAIRHQLPAATPLIPHLLPTLQDLHPAINILLMLLRHHLQRILPPTADRKSVV